MPIPGTPQPISRSSMREEVYSTLLSWIMVGELRPGEKLLDKELSEHLGVSRTPVREALRRLEDKGLVETAANRWTRVTEVAIEEPARIYPIIWTLEELAISLVIGKLTDKDFQDMKKSNHMLAEALEKKDPIQASRADINFHNSFIQRTENSHLIAILQDLKIRYRRVEVNYFDSENCARYSVEEHNRILESLGSRDLKLSQEMIRANWQASLQRIQKTASSRKV